MEFSEAFRILKPEDIIPVDPMLLAELKNNHIISLINLKLEETTTALYRKLKHDKPCELDVMNDIFSMFNHIPNDAASLQALKDASAKDFNYHLQNSYEEFHHGSCVGVPATCLRCYSRDLLYLPSDSPSSKEIGSTALRIFFDNL